MSEAETLPESFRLSEPDRRVLTAGIVLLFMWVTHSGYSMLFELKFSLVAQYYMLLLLL